MSKAAIALSCSVLLAGCASTPSNTWTSADTTAYEKFRAERLAQANALAREGDQALAGSNPERALERYALALKAIGLRGRLGVAGKAVGGGYQITEVVPELPVARAGLRTGDLIVRVRGMPAKEMGVAQWDIAFQRNPGEGIPVTVARGGGAPFDVTVVSRHWVWRTQVPREAEVGLIRSLRFKAAGAAGRARSLPPIPAAAREHAVRAQAQARTAKTRDDFDDVSTEFEVASLLAPWWGDIFINYALFQEASEDAIGARESLALYLETRPNAPDRAAVSQKQAALASKAEEQKRLMAWEGFWGEIVNGRLTDSGIRFERQGRLLTAKNNAGFEFLRGTVVDEYTAQTVQRFGSQYAGSLGPVVQRCFNGLLELSGTMKLTPDKRRLTINMADFNVDPRTCRMQSSNAAFQYGR